jgi:hypothetical protein
MDTRESNRKGGDTTLLHRWSRQLRRGRTLLLALSVIAASSASAHALDLCMDGSVIKRFKAPSKNKCVPIQGVENAYFGGAMSGMACTSATGETLILNYTSHDWQALSGYQETGTCRAALPISPAGNAGVCGGTYTTTPGGSNHFWVFANFRYCSVDIPD